MLEINLKDLDKEPNINFDDIVTKNHLFHLLLKQHIKICMFCAHGLGDWGHIEWLIAEDAFSQVVCLMWHAVSFSQDTHFPKLGSL